MKNLPHAGVFQNPRALQGLAYIHIAHGVDAESVGRDEIGVFAAAHAPAAEPASGGRHYLYARRMCQWRGRRVGWKQAGLHPQLREVESAVLSLQNVVGPVYSPPLTDILPVRQEYLYAAVLPVRHVDQAGGVHADAVGNPELSPGPEPGSPQDLM